MDSPLSRRERQILDVLYRLGVAGAAEIEGALPDAPSNSAVRTHLKTLESKGLVRRELDGLRFLYRPATPRARARKPALRHLVETFFDGSAADAAAALLDDRSLKLSSVELDRLADLIEKARREGR